MTRAAAQGSDPAAEGLNMPTENIKRRSRWMIRALEWNDPKARYPNLWHQGMPVHLMAFDTIARRLRLGDLVAIYHPASQRYTRRGGKFLGISRVTGLRKGFAPDFSWIDLETAHRFDRPLDLGAAPRRVFLCCDQEWPSQDSELFDRVFAAAVEDGFLPLDEEQAGAASAAATETAVDDETHDEHEAPEELAAVAALPAEPEGTAEPVDEEAVTAHVELPVPEGRLFGGVESDGDMRDRRDGTWLAIGVVDSEERFRVVRLEATGRSGLQGYLGDPDRALLNAEAIGFTFPFALPEGFAESLLGGKFPEEGWWSLARRFEKLHYPDYLVSLQDFRESHGEVKRLTDERAGALSPLHRTVRDRGPVTYHGIRMIAEERSRYVVRPFESAQGRLILEVYPDALIRKLAPEDDAGGGDRRAAIVQAVGKLEKLPVILEGTILNRCRGRADALEAVLAARAAAVAVLSGEAEKTPEELAGEAADRVRKEGWIYGVE